MMGTAKKGVTVTEQMPPAVDRRHLLGISMSAGGVIALSACGGAPPKSSKAQPSRLSHEEAPVTPPEDLMREHGVLKRVLLIYREAIRRLQDGEQDPTLDQLRRRDYSKFHRGLPRTPRRAVRLP